MHAKTVRRAMLEDLQAINGIYNHAVQYSAVTMDIAPLSCDVTRSWFDSHSACHPICVCELDSSIVGWGAISPLCSRPGYCETSEVSIYVDHRHRGVKVGTTILSWLMDDVSKGASMHTLLALITAGNMASVRLFQRFGFVHVGRWAEVGYKFGSYHDLDILQLVISR